MKKFDLLRKDDRVIRVLEMKPGRVLVIDCIKRTMPVWVEVFSDCTMEDLIEVTGFTVSAAANLDTEQRKTMYDQLFHDCPCSPLCS